MYGTSSVLCGLASCAQKASPGTGTCTIDAAIAAVGMERPIRIHTLGRFGITIGGLALLAGRKRRQRPAGVLKALRAMGGRDIAASMLWECLWPDADGDIGARNLAVTLHRLRELLGSSATLLLHDGKLSLNDRVCWVDVWCFERCVSQGLARLEAGGDDAEAVLLLRRAFDLYGGHFLAFESEQHWMLSARLRLRSKFERLVSALGDRLERRQDFSGAADVWQRGLERDPMNELLHRRLMRGYLLMGEHSSVLRSYRRCLEAMNKGLGIQPSIATQEIYLEAVRAISRKGAAGIGVPGDCADPAGQRPHPGHGKPIAAGD